MAEPTFSGTPGVGPAIRIDDSENTSGAQIDMVTTYGYRSAIRLVRAKPNNGTLQEAHIILGEGIPSAVDTYDSAPLGSMYINLTGGDGTCLYLKEVAGAEGWAPVLTAIDA